MKISFFFTMGTGKALVDCWVLVEHTPLALRFHVALLGFLGIREILADIIDIDEGPG